MALLFTTPNFNAYMKKQRERYIQTRSNESGYDEKEDAKKAAEYFPYVYNNRGQLMKSGYVVWEGRTGLYSWHRNKPSGW